MDGHYLPFAEVFTSEKGNTEEYRPSYKGPTQPLPKRVKRKLPYYVSVQHAKNAELMLQCSECELWRLIFSKYKLKKEECDQLEVLLSNIMYTCGATLKELDLPAVYEFVDVRDHDCIDHIEKLYYSAGKIPICVYCANDQLYTDENKYPQCNACESKPSIMKKSQKK